MDITFTPSPCEIGERRALAAAGAPQGAHLLDAASLSASRALGAGWTLAAPGGPDAPLFRVAGRVWLSGESAEDGARSWPLLEALTRDAPAGNGARTFRAAKKGYAAAWVTLSDKGAAGERKDEAGPLVGRMLGEALPLAHSQGYLLPDDPFILRALLTDLAFHQGYDLICTTGGTGLSPRDQTPQATERVLDWPLPGMAQAMMAASLAATPRAALSRAVAGVAGHCLILNLPGSPRAVRENLGAVLPALEHALAKLGGDAGDCGQA